MHTTEKNVNHLFGVDVQYQAPVYQRRYIWNETNWGTLWNDIRSQADLKLRDEDSRHFMGAIVVRPIESGQLHRFEVIDGQQRLATFQIILCIIRDICQSDGHTEIVLHTDHFLLNSSTVSGDNPESRYKFLPTPADSNAFRPIIDGNPIRNSHHLICKAHDYFKAQITTYVAADFKKIEGLLSSIVHDFVVLQVQLDTSDASENIFASLNTRGQKLSVFDQLRNNLFLRAEDETDRLYYEYWQQFDADPFWNPDTLSQFLRDFLEHKLGPGVETHDAFEIYQKQYLPTLTAGQGIEHELSELKQHAEVYRERIEHDA